jgi:hypothetical protein
MFESTWTISQPAGITMPTTAPVSRDRAMSECALPVTTGVVCLAAGNERVQGTGVRGYAHIAADDVAVVKGAFPGTSAWSPPN